MQKRHTFGFHRCSNCNLRSLGGIGVRERLRKLVFQPKVPLHHFFILLCRAKLIRFITIKDLLPQVFLVLRKHWVLPDLFDPLLCLQWVHFLDPGSNTLLPLSLLGLWVFVIGNWWGRLGQGGSFGNQWPVLCIVCGTVLFRIGQARANGRCWLRSFDWACRLGRWWPNRRYQTRGRHLSGGLHLHAGAWFFHPQSCCCTWHWRQLHFHTNRGRHTWGLHIGRWRRLREFCFGCWRRLDNHCTTLHRWLRGTRSNTSRSLRCGWRSACTCTLHCIHCIRACFSLGFLYRGPRWWQHCVGSCGCCWWWWRITFGFLAGSGSHHHCASMLGWHGGQPRACCLGRAGAVGGCRRRCTGRFSADRRHTLCQFHQGIIVRREIQIGWPQHVGHLRLSSHRRGGLGVNLWELGG